MMTTGRLQEKRPVKGVTWLSGWQDTSKHPDEGQASSSSSGATTTGRTKRASSSEATRTTGRNSKKRKRAENAAELYSAMLPRWEHADMEGWRRTLGAFTDSFDYHSQKRFSLQSPYDLHDGSESEQGRSMTFYGGAARAPPEGYRDVEKEAEEGECDGEE